MTPSPNNDFDPTAARAEDAPVPAGATVAADQASSERCMDYLLGQLSRPDAIALEQQLATSPEWNRELLIQSQLLCALADPESPVEVAVSPFQSNSLWRRLAAVSVIAAGLLIAVVGSGVWQDDALSDNDHSVASHDEGGNTSSEETLLIARAWAANHSDFSTPDDELSVSIAEPDWDFDDTLHDDSVMSWMVAAVVADTDAETSPSGATSDG